MKNYDVIVIGGGGGTKIASPCARLGCKVAVIEKEALGGTCLNRGCIPSKMLIHPANTLTHARDMAKYGITQTNRSGNDSGSGSTNGSAGGYDVDFAGLVKRVSDTVDADSAGIAESYAKLENLDHYAGEAKFVSDTVVEVNGEQLTADKIFIAVGSRPSIPPIPGLEGTPYMTSREALRNQKLPRKLLVIGGGYIACELGHVYGALGAQTTFFVRSKYLGNEDETVRAIFQESFEKKHQTHYGTQDLTVSHEATSEGDVFTVSGQDAEGNRVEEVGDALLVATGVVPNTDMLGLENTNIQKDGKGFIVTDDYLKTAVEGVYALGDCIGRYLFRHSVNFEGEYILENLFLREAADIQPIDYPPMPHAVFSVPEIAGVGPTEEQLKEQGVDYLVATHEYKSSAQGMARLPEEGMVKLMFEKSTKKLLAAHIIGDEAATMIHQLIFAATMGATTTDLLRMIYIHPALPEIIRNAVRKADAQLG